MITCFGKNVVNFSLLEFRFSAQKDIILKQNNRLCLNFLPVSYRQAGIKTNNPFGGFRLISGWWERQLIHRTDISQIYPADTIGFVPRIPSNLSWRRGNWNLASNFASQLRHSGGGEGGEIMKHSRLGQMN